MSTTPDTRQIPDHVLQAAIDEACGKISGEFKQADGLLFIDSRLTRQAWDNEAPARLSLARALLARLPEPTPPTADGKTPGRFFQSVFNPTIPWERSCYQEEYEHAASAVLAAFGQAKVSPISASYEDIAEKLCSLGWTANNDAQWEGLRDALPELRGMIGGQDNLEAGIKRMEAVPWESLEKSWDEADSTGGGKKATAFNAVRTRLIAAAREGQPSSQPAAVDWQAKSRDWPEDAADEDNGSYNCHCVKCQQTFVGHKRRTTCKDCHNKCWQARAEKAEARIKEFEESVKDIDYLEDSRNEWMQKWTATQTEVELLRAKALPQLLPISEAGPVPEGCVRVWGVKSLNGRWLWDDERTTADTHFADIRLPATAIDPYAELKAAHAAGKELQYRTGGEWLPCLSPSWICSVEDYRIKPDTTFEAHGHTWTKHTPGDPMPCDGKSLVNWLTAPEAEGLPYNNIVKRADTLMWEIPVGWRYADDPKDEPVKANYELQEHLENVKQDAPWQPAVGDVVRLKSGGPAMTVRGCPAEKCIVCDWFNNGEVSTADFPAACLQPAEEGQPALAILVELG
jgi:uncharacterized protein YodC (DUF2158 family)